MLSVSAERKLKSRNVLKIAPQLTWYVATSEDALTILAVKIVASEANKHIGCISTFLIIIIIVR